MKYCRKKELSSRENITQKNIFPIFLENKEKAVSLHRFFSGKGGI
jgi:hypothetical protein